MIKEHLQTHVTLEEHRGFQELRLVESAQNTCSAIAFIV